MIFNRHFRQKISRNVFFYERHQNVVRDMMSELMGQYRLVRQNLLLTTLCRGIKICMAARQNKKESKRDGGICSKKVLM